MVEVVPTHWLTFTAWDEHKGCRYVAGDPHKGSHRFCPNKRLSRSSYCADHARLSHKPATKIRFNADAIAKLAG